MLKRPFAEIALTEDKFQQSLNKFNESKVDEYVAEYEDDMDSMFKNAGFTIS